MPYQSVFRPDLFAGQVILVTGGGSGIGRRTTHELAALGATVAIVGRDAEKLSKVQAEVEADGIRDRITTHICDIRKEEQVIAMVDEVLARHGANLLILVTSGLCVVFAVTAAREGGVVAIRNWILAAFVIGAGFGVSKFVEYGDKFADGIGMHTNAFYMYYFALTGAHFLHFLGGMGALAFIWFHSLRKATAPDFRGKIEAVGLYWHMVDLLWILIFPLLYVLGLQWQPCP